jgi:hypothetical protein
VVGVKQQKPLCLAFQVRKGWWCQTEGCGGARRGIPLLAASKETQKRAFLLYRLVLCCSSCSQSVYKWNLNEVEVGGAPFTPTLVVSVFIVVIDHAIVVDADGCVAVAVDWCDGGEISSGV